MKSTKRKTLGQSKPLPRHITICKWGSPDYYLNQAGIIFTTVSLLTGLHKYYLLGVPEKSNDESWSKLDSNKF